MKPQVTDPPSVKIAKGGKSQALQAFDQLGGPDARAVLAIAPTPTARRSLSRSKIAAALRSGGRQRRIDERATEIQAALRSE